MSGRVMSWALLGLIAIAPAAAADRASGVEVAFGNTIVSTYPDGRQAKLWLKDGGIYTAEGRRHDTSSGAWTVKGGQICMRQIKPPTLPISYCTAIPSGGVGSSWSAKSIFGDPVKVKLVAGPSG